MGKPANVVRLARRGQLLDLLIEGVDELADSELLEFHRYVSSLAALARQRDPDYQRRHRTGLAVAQARQR